MANNSKADWTILSSDLHDRLRDRYVRATFWQETGARATVDRYFAALECVCQMRCETWRLNSIPALHQ